jgi:MarR family transcriptional regulator, organic hydroperoxide resistance regulator
MEHLKLENQLCFPLYVASRLIIRAYKPLLDQLGITYPQYLVLLVLWEKDGVPVSEITERLLLNTNTVTPLLKRMEEQGLLSRTRSREDERRVIVSLTEQGKALQADAVSIPQELVASLQSDDISVEGLELMLEQVHKIIDSLSHKQSEIKLDLSG